MTSTSCPAAIAWQMSQTWQGVLGRPLHAVQALGEDPGHRRLADASRAAKQIGLGDPVQADRVPQRLHHVVLPDDVLEPLGPIAPGDDGVIRGRGRLRRSGSRLRVGRGRGCSGSRLRRRGGGSRARPLFRPWSSSQEAALHVPEMVSSQSITTRIQLSTLPRPGSPVAGAGESRGGSPGHMKVLLMAAAFPP